MRGTLGSVRETWRVSTHGNFLYLSINTVLGWMFRKWDVGVWTGLAWLRIETSGGQL
jgi:hypothetical protein